MSKITLRADDETLVGYLPDSWGKVPLAAYAALAAADTLPQRVEATAALVGLPAGPLLADVKLYATIVAAAPWLFGGELPEASHAVSYFTHAGTTYHHVGNLERVAAEQFEALTIFLHASNGQPLTAGAGLLAVLYCPKGKAQTAAVVEAAQQDFATLPMSIAWPALAFFFLNGAKSSALIQTVSALSEQVEGLLAVLDTTLQIPGGSRISFLSLRRTLGRTWIRSVRKML